MNFSDFSYGRNGLQDYRGPDGAFNPYDFNGGTILAIAGENYSLLATDTRLSQTYSILSRECLKAYQLSETTVMGSCGFHGDSLTLTKILNARLQIFEKEHHKPMMTPSVASMLSTILYYRRFFPYYTQNLLAGLDEEGKGCVYSFDPVGSYEKECYRAKGSASSMIQSFLDNQIGGKNQDGFQKQPILLDRCIVLAKDGFASASERDIYTGDYLVISIISSNGVKSEMFPLRKD